MNKMDKRRPTWMRLPAEEIAAKREYEKLRSIKPDKPSALRPKYMFRRIRFAET